MLYPRVLAEAPDTAVCPFRVEAMVGAAEEVDCVRLIQIDAGGKEIREVVYWDAQEWKDDSTVVLAIASLCADVAAGRGKPIVEKIRRSQKK